MLTRGCAYAAELRLVIVLAIASARVVVVDFRWSMPVPLVNRVPLFLSATCSLRWCGSADQYVYPSSSLLVLGLAGFTSMCSCNGPFLVALRNAGHCNLGSLYHCRCR